MIAPARQLLPRSRVESRMRSLILLTLLALPACATEERIVSVKGNFQNLAGAQGGYETTEGPARKQFDLERALDRAEETPLPGEAVDGQPLRRKMPDGTIILITRSPRHVVLHLAATLQAKEDDLLLNQVLSERLKNNYRERGIDPMEAVKYLRKNEKDIYKLLVAIPMGDQTPGAITKTVGRNVFEVEAPGGVMLEQKFTRMQVVLESGGFKLLMVL